MATEKLLNTRIVLKHDTLQKWQNSQLKLKEGEVALARVDTNKVDPISGELVSVPTYLMKVGTADAEGNLKKFSELNWVAAPASDVHDWAKKTETEFTNWVKTLVDVEDIDLSAYYTASQVDAKFVAKEDSKSLVADSEIARLAEMSDGANKVEASDTNGKIKIDDTEVTVYTHPTSHSASEISDFAVEAAKVKVANATAADEATKATKDGSDRVITETYAEKATSLAGYSIADAYTQTETNNLVQGAKDYAKDLVDAIPAQTDYTVTISETAGGNTDNFAKKYTFTQCGQAIGEINLAKELVVTSGSVKSVTEDNKPYADAKVGDKYIELVIANQADPIYVPAKSLVDIYTAKASAAEVQIAISNTNEISATLTEAVKTELAKAHTHTFVETELNKIADGDVAKWNAAEQNAKNYTDAEIEALSLGTMSKETADDYVKKTDATGYADILTKTAAQGLYQAKGDYASSTQGAKADTAVQEVTSVAGNGIKVTQAANNDGKVVATIDWDSEVVFVFDCGTSTEQA